MHSFKLLTTVLVICALVGCAKQTTTLKPADEGAVAPAPPSTEDESVARIRELQQRVAELETQNKSLPGRDSTEHRRLMAQTFMKISQILPLLQGSEFGGAFRQQMRIIDTTRALLEGESQNLAMEPTIDTGLRATYNALASIQRQQFFEQGDIATALDALRTRVDELDTVREATHQLVATQVVNQSTGVMKQMSDVIAQRAGAAPTTNTTTTTPVAQNQ